MTAAALAPADRQRAVRRTILVIFVLNLAVAVAKGWYGLWAGSLVVTVDAFHSLLDATSNVVGWVALRMAAEPPDPEHPYGHSKFETLAATCVGIFIAVGVFEFGKEAITALVSGREPPVSSALGFVVVGGTWLVNMFVAAYEGRRGKELNSPFLSADAAHTASDVLVTGGVLAALAGVALGYTWLDPAVSLVVLVVIAWVAWTIIRKNSKVLVDRSQLDAAEVGRIAREHPAVADVHRVRSRGDEQTVQLDLHLLLDGSLSLRQAHAIAHDVEAALRAAFPRVNDVTIHMEPDDDGHEEL